MKNSLNREGNALQTISIGQRPMNVDVRRNFKFRPTNRRKLSIFNFQLSITFIAIIIIAAATTQKLLAQNEVMPKHEFTFNVFGGLSTLNYKIDDAALKKGLGGGAGLGYHYFFNDKWGFVTGIEAALYKARLNAATLQSANHVIFNQGEGWIEQGLMEYKFQKFEEKQNLLALQLPIMAKFMMPLGVSNHNLFLGFGGRFAYGLMANYKQSASGIEHRVVYDFEILFPEQAADPILYDAYEQKASLKFASFNAMASAEAGIRWKLGGNFSLYTGLYVDYGLLNIAPKRTREPLAMFTTDQQTQKLTYNSILTAHAPDYATVEGGQRVTFHRNERGYTDKVNNFAAGVKIKIAFGKTKKTPPPPIIEAPPPPKEEIPEEPVIVEEEVVVEEPVTEIPQEIVRSMMNLSNTLFEFDRWNLSAEAITELETVMKWLNDNPSIHIEIEGHTDNVGAEEYNQRLSEDRAKSVYDYFVANGVRSERLSFRGYGFSRPIADNATPEGRQQNRRVELRIDN